MKSKFKMIAIMLLCMLTIGGNITAGGKKTAKVEIDASLTPENSVVIFFMLWRNTYGDLVQINPKFPHHRMDSKTTDLATLPVKPGTIYVFDKFKGGTICNGFPCVEGSFMAPYLGSEKHENKIVVPKEPGLYLYYPYYGKNFYDFIEVRINKKMEPENMKLLRDYSISYKKITKRLKELAEMYSGTEWEPLINEHIKEWSK